MKYFVIFVIGLVVGAAGLHLLRRNDVLAPAAREGSTLERARVEARAIGDRIGSKLRDWDLDSEDIRRDLSASGRVIRKKAGEAGARIDDARIVTLIKAKYVLDEQLAALDINVDCRNGHVRLRGEVPTDEAIGRAVALALDTQGVVEVNAELTPAPR